MHIGKVDSLKFGLKSWNNYSNLGNCFSASSLPGRGGAGAACYTARLTNGTPRFLFCEMPDGESYELPGGGSCGKRAVRNSAYACSITNWTKMQNLGLGNHAAGQKPMQALKTLLRPLPRHRTLSVSLSNTSSNLSRSRIPSRAFRGKLRSKHLKPVYQTFRRHGAGCDARPLLGALFYVLLSHRVPRGSTRSG